MVFKFNVVGVVREAVLLKVSRSDIVLDVNSSGVLVAFGELEPDFQADDELVVATLVRDTDASNLVNMRDSVGNEVKHEVFPDLANVCEISLLICFSHWVLNTVLRAKGISAMIPIGLDSLLEEGETEDAFLVSGSGNWVNSNVVGWDLKLISVEEVVL